MNVRTGTTTLLFVVLLVHHGAGALRVRYSVPRYHRYTTAAGDTVDGSHYANREFSSDRYRTDGIEPGVWDGWDSAIAFDSAEGNGNLDSAVFVDAAFWVDSLLEPKMPGPYAHNVGVLRDLTKGRADDGYIVYAYGGIRFPSPGTWTLLSSGDDGGTVVAIDLNNDSLLHANETREEQVDRSVLLAVDTLSPPLSHTWWNRFRVYRLEGVKADRFYRFSARYYDYSGPGASGLFWRGPGDSATTPVPASAFGRRRNFGAPESRIAAILTPGGPVPWPDWGFVDVQPGDTVLLHALAVTVPNIKPLYLWELGDGTFDTTLAPTVAHVYAAGHFVPAITVKYGTVHSMRRGNQVVIAVGR